ncbi:MAG: TetR/AcrR family transcriptional regulator [Sphaerochaetaceae bacterium]|jgi:AcrR family transcriptional regulator|nr:TetR/AcrR family transcriptional regulator [Sphaerochaetaceae bacterium]
MSKKETRIKIQKAAEKLFSEEGYDGVSTKLIAKEAGITEMTLFNHFDTKEALYKSIVKERYLSIEIKSGILNLSYNNLEKDLMKISEKIIENFNKNKSILLMRLREKQSFHEDSDFKIEKDPLLRELIPFFQVYEEKKIINIEAEKTAKFFILNLKGIFHLAILENSCEETINSIINENINIFCNGILNKG